jgi:hypothetical protein
MPCLRDWTLTSQPVTDVTNVTNVTNVIDVTDVTGGCIWKLFLFLLDVMVSDCGLRTANTRSR